MQPALTLVLAICVAAFLVVVFWHLPRAGQHERWVDCEEGVVMIWVADEEPAWTPDVEALICERFSKAPNMWPTPERGGP